MVQRRQACRLYRAVRVSVSVTVQQLARDLPALTKLERAIELNAEESDGPASFAEAVFALTHHARVSEVRIVSRDSKSQTVKRGAPALTGCVKAQRGLLGKTSQSGQGRVKAKGGCEAPLFFVRTVLVLVAL